MEGISLIFFDIKDMGLHRIYFCDEVTFLKQLGWSPMDAVINKTPCMCCSKSQKAFLGFPVVLPQSSSHRADIVC